jgi:hypothetical protein
MSNYNIRLNPLKGVFACQILGFILSRANITVDPLKVQAIYELPPPHNLYQLQSLQGKANLLHRFFQTTPPFFMVSYFYYVMMFNLYGMINLINSLMR